jgi:hypothetical protein
MKQKNLVIAVIVLLVMNVVTVIGWSKSMNQVDEYHHYYVATEKFLNELDVEYDWVDAFDPQDYYDATSKLRKN